MAGQEYKVIDAVVNIWTEEALSHRPDWGDDFFTGKMNVKSGLMEPMSLEQTIENLDEARIDKAFLIAAHAGRPGLPGCYHMPYEVVARACEQYPDRFCGLAGIDPFDGMKGVKAFEDAVTNMVVHRRPPLSALVRISAGPSQVLSVLRQMHRTRRSDTDASRPINDLFPGFSVPERW